LYLESAASAKTSVALEKDGTEIMDERPAREENNSV
jgi:hypothetical protein